jgi:predicted metalloprotease
MRWQEGHRSPDVIDARGPGGGGGGFGGMRLGFGGLVVVGILSVVFRTNLFPLFSGGTTPARQAPAAQGPQRTGNAEEDRQVHFVSFVLDDVQANWTRIMPTLGRPYERARLVVFTEAIRTGCGAADSAIGPFYCPADQRVYIDLGFFRELRARFGAPGDFAQAYVLAHEVGHHAQHLLGIEARARAAQSRDPARENDLSVRMELQADCFAGVWAHSTQQRNLLEAGDLEEGLAAAAAVGDDRIQRSAGQQVRPESWTHGSAAQRASWFRRGWTSGDPNQCDTFGG